MYPCGWQAVKGKAKGLLLHRLIIALEHVPTKQANCGGAARQARTLRLRASRAAAGSQKKVGSSAVKDAGKSGFNVNLLALTIAIACWELP